MADWTNVPDTTFEPGAPAKGRDMRFLRDNPIAIAEGAPGAPRIQTDGINNSAVTNPKVANGAVTNPKVANGTLGAEKFQTGNNERDWVLARTAAAQANAVGTYAFMRSSLATRHAGATVTGSSLGFSNVAGEIGSPGLRVYPAGTWRLMGYTHKSSRSENLSLWLRIS